MRTTTYTAIRESGKPKWLNWLRQPKWLKRWGGLKSRRELLDDYQKHRMDADQKGNTDEYLQAVLSARAAQEQQRWAIVAAVAACLSVAVAVAALIVAVN